MPENLNLAEISVETLNTNFTEIEDAVNAKAEINGDLTQKFNVADAVELTEAINKKQLDNSVATINTAITSLETEIATKASKSYVDANLALKANSTDVEASLATKIDISDTTVTKQGNTFNGPNQLVQLDTNGKLPAIDGSFLTGISGGVSAIEALGTVTSNFTLTANKITTANVTASCALSLPTILDNTKETKCIFDFTTFDASYPTLPSGILKKDGKALTFSALSGVRNVLTFTTRDAGTTWEAELQQYGGVETPYILPTLSSNGTLGGSSFAVSTTGQRAGYEFYQAFDGNSNTFCCADYFPITQILYFPTPVRLTNISFLNSSAIGNCFPPKAFTLYGSNDNITYAAIGNYTNTVYTLGSTGNVSISTSDFYKYYKLVISSAWNCYGQEQTSYIEVITIGISGYYIATA